MRAGCRLRLPASRCGIAPPRSAFPAPPEVRSPLPCLPVRALPGCRRWGRRSVPGCQPCRLSIDFGADDFFAHRMDERLEWILRADALRNLDGNQRLHAAHPCTRTDMGQGPGFLRPLHVSRGSSPRSAPGSTTIRGEDAALRSCPWDSGIGRGAIRFPKVAAFAKWRAVLRAAGWARGVRRRAYASSCEQIAAVANLFYQIGRQGLNRKPRRPI